MATNSNDKFSMAVADPLAAFEKEGMIKLIAPAKVNLFLGIGDKAQSGFHDVTTVLHALSLHDVLHVDHEENVGKGLQVEVKTYSREGLAPFEIASEENLVYKAIHQLAEDLGRTQNEKIIVRIEKHIPAEAGLGGGSSDAAAALVGAATLWGLDAQAPEVLTAAQKLGSDIAFFLYGGCACFEGKGDVLLNKLAPMKTPLVLIKPEQGVSTAAAYQTFDKNPDLLVAEETEKANKADKARAVPFYNNLTKAAYEVLPELQIIHDWITDQPEAQKHLLCGSGSATFITCDSMDDACRLVARARTQGWWARSASFAPVAATEIPKR